jgi:GT2 family glycosyltransferase
VTVTVVVLSRRPGDWLDPCLTSVTGAADEVLVVDNGSSDAAASVIADRHGVRVLRAATNLGYAGGVNLALRQVRTDLVALLNDDAVASPEWLPAAARALAVEDVAAVTPKVRFHGLYRQLVFDDEAWSAPGDPRVLGRQIHSVVVAGGAAADGAAAGGDGAGGDGAGGDGAGGDGAGGDGAGGDVIDRILGPGVHRLETDPVSPGRRWRWTVPGRPCFVPVATAEDVVVVDGATWPAGPVCRLVNKAGSYLRRDGVLGDHGAESPDDGRFDTPAESFFASGTALVARLETFARLGDLAEPFFAYYEDGDWSWRARLAGMRLLYDPAAVVDHRHSATSGGSATAWVRHLAERNRTLTLVRNAPRRVVAEALLRVARDGPMEGVRADVARHLRWALRSRVRLAAGWQVPPEEVWERWAGADTTWDDGPIHP